MGLTKSAVETLINTAGGEYAGDGLVIRTPSMNGAVLEPSKLILVAGTALGDPGNPSFLMPDSTALEITDMQVVWLFVILGNQIAVQEELTLTTQGTDIFPNGGTTYRVRNQNLLLPIKFVGPSILAPFGFFFPLAQYVADQRSDTRDLGTQSGNVNLLLSEASNFRVKLNGNVTLDFVTAGADWIPGKRGAIEVEQSAAGGDLLTFGGTIRYEGGAIAPLTATANAVDLYEYVFSWDGAAVTIRKIGTDVS
jgi:hypothetical protein